MKAVILAGGYGTRMREETETKPKPMVLVGGKPILWHIMSHFSAHGVADFIICCGYKGHVIKDYFLQYSKRSSDITIDLAQDHVQFHNNHAEPWRVSLIDTGLDTMTGGRLKRVAQHVGQEDFFFTYGDGLSDIDLSSLLTFHQRHGLLATVTAVRAPNQFGVMRIGKNDGIVERFEEKPSEGDGWINGGFFVLSPRVTEFIDGDRTSWEREPMERLTNGGHLGAYKHSGFWQCMDTSRDREKLDRLWDSGEAPWKTSS